MVLIYSILFCITIYVFFFNRMGWYLVWVYNSKNPLIYMTDWLLNEEILSKNSLDEINYNVIMLDEVHERG